MQFFRLRSLCKRALLQGAQMSSVTRVLWELHGVCDKPVSVVHFHRPPVDKSVDGRERRDVVVGPGRAKPLELELTVPCGRCESCGARKRRIWTVRALTEAESAYLEGRRTWFATLTCSPDYLYRCRAVCSVEMLRKSVIFDAMSPEVQFRKLDGVIYRDIQKWLKRLRFAGAKLTFMCVTEAHKSGEPHYHSLIHETVPGHLLLKDALKAANWSGGFANYKLITDPRAAGYLCKYVAKSTGRVRASKAYGVAMDRASELA